MNKDKEELNIAGDQNNWINLVKKQVDSLRFGIVQIVVHDSRVVQIERTEKVRLDHQREG